MSHFSVLVVTKEDPSTNPSVLTLALAPFHQFECTGHDDKYIQDIDLTEELLHSYLSRKVDKYSLNGQILDQEACYRAATEEELNSNPLWPTWGTWKNTHIRTYEGMKQVFAPPTGAIKVEIPNQELISFEDYVKEQYGYSLVTDSKDIDKNETHKYGYVLKTKTDTKVIQRTNPSYKWDWWVLGGRWSNELATQGKVCNTTALGALDIAHMTKVQRRQRIEAIYTWLNSLKDLPITITGSCQNQEQLEAILQHPTLRDLDKQLKQLRLRLSEIADYIAKNPKVTDLVSHTLTKEEQELRNRMWDVPYPLDKDPTEWLNEPATLHAFAVLDSNGVWHAAGEMLMFGCVKDEKEQWSAQFINLVENIAPNHFISLVDCHI